MNRRNFLKWLVGTSIFAITSNNLVFSLANTLTSTPLKIESSDNSLSSEGAKTYPLYLGSKRIGALVKCEAQKDWQTKVMFMTAKRSPNLFDKIVSNNITNYYPNITAIQQYFKDRGIEENKEKQISLITTWPTFTSYNDNILSWLNYDNGVEVGNETNIDKPITSNKWIVIISWWKLTITHTSEINQTIIDNLISKGADIITSSSMLRNGSLNENASLWYHPYWHSLVQFKDGSRWELFLNNCEIEEKKQVVTELFKTNQITRAVYADADAYSNFLDQVYIQTKNGLQPSHPNQGDLLTGKGGQSWNTISKGNMPGIIIFYAEKSL